MQKPDPIQSNFKGKDILSLDQFDTQSIEKVFFVAREMAEIAKNAKQSDLLAGNILTLLFYEPSSRTFGSFDAAAKRLGGKTIVVQNPTQVSSVAKGENFQDTIRTFESYSEALVIRHPEVGTLQKAANAATIPVISAGDGIGEHPTQALLDLYTIYEKFGRFDGLTGLIAGDIKNGRTVHSLIRGLSLFKNITLYLLAPTPLMLDRSEYEDFTKRGIKIIEIASEQEIPKNANFWYWTRVQKERITNASDYETVKNSFIVTKALLQSFGSNDMILMHPLPRVGEIAEEVDDDPRSVYLKTQMRNGMYVRMALLALVLGKM